MTPDSGRVLPSAEHYAARNAARATERAELLERVRALMTDGVERYSAEVAEALELDVKRACARVARALKILAKRGELTSRKCSTRERGCLSGMGRRYYKHAARG